MNSFKNNADIYDQLAELWSGKTWAWLDYVPAGGALQALLRELFSEEEALALCHVPVKPVPLDFTSLTEIAANSELDRDMLERTLDGLVGRGLLFYGKTAEGAKAYALPKLGYGFSQLFYWQGDQGPQTRKIVELEKDQEYANAKKEMFLSPENNTKAWRYVPVTASIDPHWQNVYPTETIETIIKNASRFVLVHCPCRVQYQIKKGESCGHSTDVCIKMDELAESLLACGIGEEINREQALQAIKKANDEGLVHFTDNTEQGIKHICNCCGCACWNLVPIKKRKIPRDVIMATYFMRCTRDEECTGCGACAEICPVDAVSMEEGAAVVDSQWCIGCGVCVPKCPTEAVYLVEKEQKPQQTKEFSELYNRLNSERQARKNK